MKPINFLSCKKAYYVKLQDFSKFLWKLYGTFYGLDTEPEPEP